MLWRAFCASVLFPYSHAHTYNCSECHQPQQNRGRDRQGEVKVRGRREAALVHIPAAVHPDLGGLGGV